MPFSLPQRSALGPAFSRGIWCALVCAIGNLLATNSLLAAKGEVLNLPAGNLNPSGVRMVVDSRWIDATGYRPIRIEIIPRKPPTADRQFRVVIRPHGNRDQISQIIELPQGATRAKATIAVPQDATVSNFAVEVFEDGYRHEDLSLDWHRYGSSRWEWNEATPGVLLIDSRAPSRNKQEELVTRLGQGRPQGEQPLEKVADIRNLIRAFPDPNQGRGNQNPVSKTSHDYDVSPDALLAEIVRSSKGEVLHPDELPQRWIEYSSFDLIFISQADLLALKTQQPAALQALGDWARAGHTLVIYNSGKNFTGLGELEKELKLSPLTDDKDEKYRGWRFPNPKLRGKALRDYYENPYNRGPRMKTAGPVSGSGAGDDEIAINIEQPPDGSRHDDWKFALRPAGLGQLVAFEGDPFPGSKTDWDWLLNSIPGSGWNPLVRTGTSQQYRNEDFWNFLIAGTGQAPVLSFLVLITGFVMLIGPVNYFFLQRRQRLYLLLVTVPLGAFLVTLSLFLYAIVTDGLGVKSRVRSYTVLDQRTGLGASVSRQAYYASIAPSQGLRFEDDTTILPLIHKPSQRGYDQVIRRNVQWNERDQQLKSGYLASRTLSQMIVTKSGSTKARLQIGKADGGQLPVTNELGANIVWLMVIDHDGQFYRGQGIKAGEAKLASIDSGIAHAELKKMLIDAEPRYPIGYSENMHETPLERIDGQGPWGSVSPIDQADSLLERNLARIRDLLTHPIEPRSYIAIIDHSPLVPLGTRTRQYSSLQVIEGTW